VRDMLTIKSGPKKSVIVAKNNDHVEAFHF